MAVSEESAPAAAARAVAEVSTPSCMRRAWEPRNLGHNAVSLGGELLLAVEWRRLSETDSALQLQILPSLVHEERKRPREPGGTRLHFAADRNCLPRARALLAAGAAPAAVDGSGFTPLQRSATRWGGGGAVGALLVRDEGAYPLEHLQSMVADRHLLECIVDHRADELLAALLERGLKPDLRTAARWENALRMAASRSQVRVMELLLDAGTSLESQDAEARGTALLLAAARLGAVSVARLLLERGVAVDHCAGGHSVLVWACKWGHVEVVRLLLARGASLASAPGIDPPLHAATQRGHVPVMAALLAAGAGLNERGVYGGTPLLVAADRGHVEAVQLLLAHGALARTRGEGRTPLHAAAGQGHVAVMQALLEADAAVDAVGADGGTPLIEACRDGHVEAVRLLLDARAAVNHRSADGSTALWVACTSGRLEAAQLLHARGADPSIPGEGGKTALEEARNREHAEVVAWLEGVAAVSASEGAPSAAGGSAE